MVKIGPLVRTMLQSARELRIIGFRWITAMAQPLTNWQEVEAPEREQPQKPENRPLVAKPQPGRVDYAALREAVMVRFAKTLARLAK